MADWPEAPTEATPASLAQGVGVLGQLRHDGQRDLEAGQHRLGEGRQLVGAPALGGELLGEHVVHLRGRETQALGLAGEVATDLVGVQVGLGEQVTHAGERQLPSVAGGAQELLEHRELDGLVRTVGGCELQPAVERGDVVALALRERLVDHDVGVAARVHLAEQLHQGVVAERDGGVALLAREQRRVGVQVQVVAWQSVEGQVAVALGAGGGVVEGPQVERGGLAVVDGVVGDHGAEVVVLPGADQGVPEAFLLLVVVGER